MRSTRRPMIPAAAAMAVAVMAAWPVGGVASTVRGEVTFEGRAAIPPGVIELRLVDAAAADGSGRPATVTRVPSDGKSAEVPFALPPPADTPVSPTLQVVATLERSDGWLVARGSAPVAAGTLVHVTLHAAIY